MHGSLEIQNVIIVESYGELCLATRYSERSSGAFAQFNNLNYLFSVSSESLVQIAWDTKVILKVVREEMNKSFRELREIFERKERENENIMKDLKKFLQEVKTEK